MAKPVALARCLMPEAGFPFNLQIRWLDLIAVQCPNFASKSDAAEISLVPIPIPGGER